MSKTVGQRIKELRELKGLTQDELGRLVGCAQNTVAEWEKRDGRGPSKKFLGQLAQVLETSIEELLEGLQKKTPKIPYYGEVSSNEFIWPNQQIYTQIEKAQRKKERVCFSFKIVDDLLEPVICKGDYCTFEKLMPQDGDIAMVRFPQENNKAILRRWRQRDNNVVLIEINPYKMCPPYFIEILPSAKEMITKTSANQNVIVEGRLLTIKRKNKSLKPYPRINYIFF